MNYALFCTILNDNLIYEFSDAVSLEQREEYQQYWYIEFKEQGYWMNVRDLTNEQKVVAWMREHFQECSFDTHNFQLKDR